MQSAPAGAINLALGELGFPLPELMRKKAISLLETNTPVYTPNAGLPELRMAIADQYPAADPERICVCNGAEEAIFVTLMALIDPGDLIAIPDPDYTAYFSICKIFDANVIRLPYESDLLSVDWAVWEYLLQQNVKALVLSHPSNPSGHVFTDAEVARLLDICAANDVVLIVDEIYARLCFDTAPPSFWRSDVNVCIIGGVSKSHCMSGWRIGWVLAPQSISASIVKARQYVSTCSNWLSQKLAEYALSAEGLEAVDEILGQLKDRRRIALDKLKGLSEQVLIPTASPYLMLKVVGDDVLMAQDLARKGVIAVPGSAFGQMSKGWLRINYAVSEDKLIKALDILCHELHLY